MKSFTAAISGAILVAITIASAAVIPAEMDRASELFLSRNRRYLGSGTNPNNIQVSLGNQQIAPSNYGGSAGWGNQQQSNYGSLGNQYGSNYGSSYNSVGGSGGSFQQVVDVGNVGGTHQSNVGIGGIQNFAGARGEAQIQKLLADSNNNGGSHQTNAGIGGLLLF